jgi:AraC-like DNA-binding protein
MAATAATAVRARTRNPLSADDVLNLLHKATRVGADPNDILRKAGAPFSLADLEAGRVPAVGRKHMTAIYRECVVTIGWHSSRLDNKPQMHPDEFRLMCHCLITARTLGQALERQAMFYRTRGDRLSALSLAVDRGVATLSVDTLRRRKSFGAFLSDLAGMSIFARFYAWLIGMGGHVFHVGLAYGPPFTDEPVADFFVGELTFGHPVNTISFPERLLAMPVVRTPDELEALLQEFPFDFMAEKPAGLTVSDRVRSLYSLTLMRDGRLPPLDELAALCGLSGGTLRRRLQEADVSIRSLKDEARREVALALMARGRETVDDVAARVGFRDADTFRAAFRRWTGLTPSAFRRGAVTSRKTSRWSEGSSSRT